MGKEKKGKQSRQSNKKFLSILFFENFNQKRNLTYQIDRRILSNKGLEKWDGENRNVRLRQEEITLFWIPFLIVHFAIMINPAKSIWTKKEIQAEFNVPNVLKISNQASIFFLNR